MNFSLARQYFYQEIQQADEEINLAKAALYIAQEEYPDLDPEEYLNTLDTMAWELEERLPQERYPLRMIQTINQYIYEDLGFSGNKIDYYDPRNSYLNDVIDRRLGIPITLALVYLEIARRIDFPMVGIGMPGHFLIRPDLPDMEIFVDAFNSGEIIFAEDCQERLSQLYQQPVTLQPEFLAVVTNRQFLARMLTNLKFIYLKQQKLEKTLGAVERILLLFPDLTLELRDRGLIYYQLGYYPQAAQDLQTYLLKVPDAQDAAVIRRLLGELEKDG
ncbi:MAG: SirB1 family protein [Nostoc sp. ZfuVER08]|jgi:regulator of sirC expression with transglutaminase-like and TPR domain|uniref:SirB1 family protein n=1 Tax=Nostoc punctiforme FACHB-252 TaxID=1357509 RepID=A0ABR8H6Q6_NOSPU|nr:SirB1 family protein [Nostoc punctiforme]MBD2610947.1 SirB1 family protein [Nostoc punctiforme FACHB-252]MBL1203686.1 tetratricopeptide repeat protein [Nostoc sp. GBBB01]MDZ8010207.1 SirB1 family protein [Nostoc sp. ZfuVER08]